MHKLSLFVCITVLAALTGAAGGNAATGAPMSMTKMASLSSPAALAPQTTVMDKKGDYTVSTVTLDPSSSAVLLASGPCGDFGYNAVQKWYDPWGIVLWTYQSHFSVHVCNGLVRYVVSLYDQPLDSTLGWGWCGSVVRQQLQSLPYTSARSYTEGCFSVLYKIADVRYPWARMTIGYNGGLWARSTGVG